MAQPNDVDGLRRDLQLASIADIQGSIHANDQKSSAGLIVHGLLFAGVTAVATNLESVVDGASPWGLGLGGSLLVAAFLFFVLSVRALARAVEPYDPDEVTSRIEHAYRHVFFPVLTELRGKMGCPFGPAHEQAALMREVGQVTSDGDIQQVYAAEQVKLADIREVQAERAKRGFRWLRRELYAVAGFLAVVAAVALSAPVLAADDGPGGLALRWTVDNGQRRAVAGGGQLGLDTDGEAIEVTVLAEGADDIRSVSVIGTATLRCVRAAGGPTSSIVLPLQASNRASGDEDRLETTLTVDTVERCANVPATRIDLVAEAQLADGSSIRATLVVDTR